MGGNSVTDDGAAPVSLTAESGDEVGSVANSACSESRAAVSMGVVGIGSADAISDFKNGGGQTASIMKYQYPPAPPAPRNRNRNSATNTPPPRLRGAAKSGSTSGMGVVGVASRARRAPDAADATPAVPVAPGMDVRKTRPPAAASPCRNASSSSADWKRSSRVFAIIFRITANSARSSAVCSGGSGIGSMMCLYPIEKASSPSYGTCPVRHW